MDAKQWLAGLVAAVVMGAATAGGSWMAINAAGAAGATVPVLNLKALGIILLVGAGTNLFSFLKQSPIPTSIRETTVTVTKEVTNKES
jgi:deoxyxylulose-5-phosphate synthase